MRNNQHDPGCAEVQLEVREGKKEGGITRVAVLHRPSANITPTSIFSKKQMFLTTACKSGWCLKDAVMNGKNSMSRPTSDEWCPLNSFQSCIRSAWSHENLRWYSFLLLARKISTCQATWYFHFLKLPETNINFWVEFSGKKRFGNFLLRSVKLIVRIISGFKHRLSNDATSPHRNVVQCQGSADRWDVLVTKHSSRHWSHSDGSFDWRQKQCQFSPRALWECC